MRSRCLVIGLLAISSPLLAQQEMKVSVQSIRTTGTALMAYFTDHPAVPGESGTGDSTAEPQTVSWMDCPSVTYEQAVAALEPRYVRDVPRLDGFGHELEFCLRQDASAPGGHAVGVRSPGRDGIWDATVYDVGSFDSEDVDRDVVWIDGYFVTWPEARPRA